MKKALALLLALVMCLSLCACGGGADTTKTNESAAVSSNGTSKEEMLADAVEIDGHTLYQEYDSNKVKAAGQYEGTTCLVEGTVDTIENDYIAIVDSNLKVNVYLPTEEIVELEKNQFVKAVGILENMDFEQNMSLVYVTVDFNTGYLAESTYSKTGIYYATPTTDGTHPQGVYMECVNSNGKTYFVELVLTDEQKTKMKSGAEATVEGQLFPNDSTMPHHAGLKMIVTNVVSVA